ncbi:hypothetical protein MOQ_001663 [Trypanosoma cruzi marinkellei]|uniref:C2 domain-containing protein n=1 Tax=Trypanosoma cruzi marinkellei TaxID=85056 RepID=K2NFT3_TRYCR|nr:hypothetical protein MOQ_001663 [Trypanosoma cruzi marinkellei]
MIKIRILHLSVLSEDAGDFRHAGLYVVMRVGDEAQRTSVLVEGERKSWDEVFLFRLPPSLPALGVGMSLGAPFIASGSLARDTPQYLPFFQHHHHPLTTHDSIVAGSSMNAMALAPPWVGDPYGDPSVALELWRHSATSDDCLAKYQFCLPHDNSGGVLDRCVRLMSASSYSVEFALRVRVALLHADSTHAIRRSSARNTIPLEAPVSWGP